MAQLFNRQTLIQSFQLNTPVEYHSESLKRLNHLNPNALRKAAVLIGFVERDNGLHVLFTKRAKHLKHHPGQVSFPGGKYEPDDKSLVTTAIRETQEETGINPSLVQIFGQMNELPTVSQFSVTPYLAFIKPNYQAKIDQNEVAEIFEVPVDIVLNPDHLHSEMFRFKDHHHRVFALTYQRHFIWGMTAQIIHALQRQLPKPLN